MTIFNGTLRANEIFAPLFNMIISQQVFTSNFGGLNGSLMERSRVDGTLYGDTKIYYSTELLKSYEFGNDGEATNLLQLHRPNAPHVQAITIDTFRQIPLTVDHYLTKRAWMDEGAFSQFNSVILAQIVETRIVYDTTTFNTFIGTNETVIGLQSQTIDLSSITETGEAKNRLEAQMIANHMSNMFDEMSELSSDYNDHGILRAYNISDFEVVWNNKWLNKITKIDLPTIYHKDGLMGDLFKEKLNHRYFGNILPGGGTAPANNKTIRSLIETDFGDVHVFPGQLIPAGGAYGAEEAYEEDENIICKVFAKGSVPYMSALEVSTVFVNPKSLTETHYNTFGRSTLEHLAEYVFGTVRAV